MAVQDLQIRKARICQLEVDLKKEVDEFHKISREYFKIEPSSQPMSMADIAQVVMRSLELSLNDKKPELVKDEC